VAVVHKARPSDDPEVLAPARVAVGAAAVGTMVAVDRESLWDRTISMKRFDVANASTVASDPGRVRGGTVERRDSRQQAGRMVFARARVHRGTGHRSAEDTAAAVAVGIAAVVAVAADADAAAVAAVATSRTRAGMIDD